MGYTLTKKFRFESAHRLGKGYVGKCNNIHGHSWNGEIAIYCHKLDGYDMGVDYSILGEFCKDLENELDHKLWLYKEDPTIKFLTDTSIVLFDRNPTSEALAQRIHGKLKTWLVQKGIKVGIDYSTIEIEYVKVSETCTTSCTYSKKDRL